MTEDTHHEIEEQMTHEEIEAQIMAYERMYGMNSEEFLRLVHDHTAPDTFETNVWMALLENRNI